MATFHFNLVAPEKLLLSSEVTQVDVPGAEGDFGVLAGHAPMVATMRPGILVVYGEAGEQLRIVVNGGFAEVGPSGLTVLADAAVPLEEFDRSALAGLSRTYRGRRGHTAPSATRPSAGWSVAHVAGAPVRGRVSTRRRAEQLNSAPPLIDRPLEGTIIRKIFQRLHRHSTNSGSWLPAGCNVDLALNAHRS